MYSRVNPPTTLREKDAKGIWYNGLTNRLRAEYVLPFREGLQHERGQITILSKKKQILLVQRIDDILRIVLDDVGVG